MKFLSQINVNTEYILPFVDGTNGQVLTTDGNGAVYWGSVSAGATNLNALTDVELTSPSTGQILRYEMPQGGTVPIWRNVTPGYLDATSSINALGDVTITSAVAGQILQFNGTFWINTTLSTVEYVSKVQHTVKAGVAITKGQAVYVTSADGTNMIVGLASNASEATSSKVIGLAASNAAINGQIFVVTEGLLAGLDTSTATAGDPVWLGTNGNLIFGLLNKPASPAHLVYIGVVTRAQQNNGEIFVNVQNGIEIDEIHDVQISSPATGQLLRRDSDGYWKNWSPNFLTAEADTLATVTARGATTTGNIVVNGEISLPSFIRLTNAGANNAYISESWGINLNGASTHPIQVRSASLSVGYTLGAGTSYGSGNLFVSDKIGVNTTAPTKALDVVGSGIVASFGGSFSIGSFAGIHFGYSETQYGNDNYKKSALVFERTDNHIGQGSNASGKIHFLLNNAGGTSATSLSHSVLTIDSNANGTAGTSRVGIGRTSPFYALDVNGQTNSTSFVSTSILILDADLNQGQQPQQGDPANKVASFRWAGNEQGYIDTDAKITFAGFKTPTGTASQFLKANGTVDSNTYLTTASAASLYTTYDYVDDEIAAVNTYVNSTFVPKTRTLTINGTAFDLSANRSWTITTTDSTKVSKSGESHDTVLPDTLASGDGGFYTVANGYGPSGGNDALIHVPYSNNTWAHQIAMDWALGDAQDMWFRTKNAGTWQAWKKVWHDGNFTPSNYQLASTAINTGNIATQSVAYATSSGNSNLLKSLGSYVWSASTNGRDFQEGMQISFVRQADGYQNFGSVVRIHTYPNDGASAELYFPYSEEYGGNSMQYRLGLYNNAGWSSWKTVVDSENIGLYALTSLPSHNHDDRYYTETESDARFYLATNPSGYQTTSGTVANVASGETTNLNSAWTAFGTSIGNGFRVLRYSESATNKPTAQDNANWLINIYSHPTGGSASYGHQLAAANNNNIYFRSVSNGSFSDWHKFWSTNDFSSTAISNWNAAYNDKINSASFNTADGILTLTQQDGGTVTVDLDGRYLTSDTDAQTLTWDGLSKTLGITNGNDVILSELATEDYVLSQGFVTSVANLAIQTIGGDSSTFNLDTVSGQHGFVRFSTGTWGGTNPYPGNYSHVLSMNQSTVNGNRTVQMYMGDVPGALFWRMNQGGTLHPWERIWTAANDGADSGLNADLLDGNHASAFALASHTHTIANVTGLQTALDGKLSTSGKAADSELLDGIDESRFVYGNSNTRRGTNLISNWNQTDYPDVAFLSAEDGGTNAPSSDYTYGLQYSFHRSGAAYRTQIVTSLYGDSNIWVRNSRDSDVWTSWKSLVHSGNIGSQSVNYASSAGSSTNLYGPAGSYIKMSASGTSYQNNYQVRENDGGSNNTNEIYAPQLAFHWAGVVASSIMMEASGRIAIRNNPGTGYEAFVAGIIYSSGYGNSTQWNTAYGWGNHADAPYWNVSLTDAVQVEAQEVIFAGNVTIQGTLTESSSIRFKENIAPLDPALDKVNQLEAVSYNKIGEDNREIGLIAEDVAELFPEVVTYNEEGQPQGLNYSRLSVILLKAMQEQNAVIAALTERVNKLENK